MSDRFPFLRVYKEMADELPKEDRADFYDALFGYALDDQEPEMSGPSVGVAVFRAAAKKIVDKWKQTSAAGKSRASSGGRSLDGRWTVAGSEKPAENAESVGNAEKASESEEVEVQQTLECIDTVAGKSLAAQEKKKQEKNKYNISHNNNISNNNKSKKSILLTENKKRKSAADLVRPEDVIDLYNMICVSLPKVKVLTDLRKKSIHARLLENDPEVFRQVFERVEASDFLTARNGRWRHCNFDWIIAPQHWARILEGIYDNEKSDDIQDVADRVADALINSVDEKTVADFERSMNGGYRT